jgi:hypothetical protein
MIESLSRRRLRGEWLRTRDFRSRAALLCRETDRDTVDVCSGKGQAEADRGPLEATRSLFFKKEGLEGTSGEWSYVGAETNHCRK